MENINRLNELGTAMTDTSRAAVERLIRNLAQMPSAFYVACQGEQIDAILRQHLDLLDERDAAQAQFAELKGQVAVLRDMVVKGGARTRC